MFGVLVWSGWQRGWVLRGGGIPSAFGTSPCKGEEMGLCGGLQRERGAIGRAGCQSSILHKMCKVRLRLALRSKAEVWAPCPLVKPGAGKHGATE